MSDRQQPRLVNLTDADKAVIREKRVLIEKGIKDLEAMDTGGLDVTDLLDAARKTKVRLDTLYDTFIKS